MVEKELQKTFNIKLSSVKRLLTDAMQNEKSYKSEISRLKDIETLWEYDLDERQSRMNWQKNVIADHAASIVDSQRRLQEGLADLDTFIELSGAALSQEEKGKDSGHIIQEAKDFLACAKSVSV